MVVGVKPQRPQGGRLGLWRRFRQWLKLTMAAGGGESDFLCDTCKYDHGQACSRHERPNARRCADYEGR